MADPRSKKRGKALVDSMRSTAYGSASKAFTPSRTKQLKQRRYRERKRYRIKFVLIAVAVLAILSFCAFLIVSRLDSFSVGEVTVQGEASLSKEDIEQTATQEIRKSQLFGLIPGSSLLTINRTDITRVLLETYPQLSHVSIAISGHDIQINIREREAIGIWCTLDEITGTVRTPCLSVDSTFFAYKEAPLATRSDITPYGREGVKPQLKKHMVRGSHAEFLTSLHAEVMKRSFIPQALIVRSDETLELRLDNRTAPPFTSSLVLLPLDEALSSTLKRIDILLSGDSLDRVLSEQQASQFEYIDLRFGEKIFYKIRGVSIDQDEVLATSTEQQ